MEHDADEIWSTQYEVAGQAMANINATAADIAAIGITNQRETVVVWDKKTGSPIHNAIVWQCRRTSEYADSPHTTTIMPFLYILNGILLKIFAILSYSSHILAVSAALLTTIIEQRQELLSERTG